MSKADDLLFWIANDILRFVDEDEGDAQQLAEYVFDAIHEQPDYLIEAIERRAREYRENEA